MSEDNDLEFLKRRKLLEMQMRLLKEKALEAEKTKEKEQKTQKPKGPEEVLMSRFVDRAFEVWTAAKQQYPKATQEVSRALAQVIQSGKLKEKITGEQLYWLFQQLGIPVRLRTTIRIYEGGELKTIADKLKNR